MVAEKYEDKLDQEERWKRDWNRKLDAGGDGDQMRQVISQKLEQIKSNSGRASSTILHLRQTDKGIKPLLVCLFGDKSKRSCRCGAFFRHFGEAVQDCNGMCDNCSIELKDIDATHHTKIIVSLLHDMQLNDQRATLLQLGDKFKAKWKDLGGSNEAVDLKKEEIEQLIVQLILDHVLKEEFQHTAYATNAYVSLGPLWKPALQGNRSVKLVIAIPSQDRGGRSKSTKRNRKSNLEAKLDDLRRELSSSNGGIFPHAVLSTQQISLLNCQKPTTVAELEKLIGKVKTEKYGSKIIELMRSRINSETDGGKGIAGNGAKR